MYNGGGDIMIMLELTIGDAARFRNGDGKPHCGADRGGKDGDEKDDDGVDDDGDADSDIGNDANCGDGRSKVDCNKTIAINDSNSKSDGGGDTNDDSKRGDDSDGESNDGADGHKSDGDDDDEFLSSVKKCFKNKQIVLEKFSLSDSAR